MNPHYQYNHYNVNGFLNTEVFNLGNEPNPNYHLMNRPEIRVEPSQDFCYERRDHVMHQMYYDNNRHGNYGFQSPPRINNSYRYAPERRPFSMTETELPAYEVSVDIRLSDRRYINRNRLTEGLRLEGLRCQVQDQVVTVTGFPLNNRPGFGFLELVQNISRDRWATTITRL